MTVAMERRMAICTAFSHEKSDCCTAVHQAAEVQRLFENIMWRHLHEDVQLSLTKRPCWLYMCLFRNKLSHSIHVLCNRRWSLVGLFATLLLGASTSPERFLNWICLHSLVSLVREVESVHLANLAYVVWDFGGRHSTPTRSVRSLATKRFRLSKIPCGWSPSCSPHRSLHRTSGNLLQARHGTLIGDRHNPPITCPMWSCVTFFTVAKK